MLEDKTPQPCSAHLYDRLGVPIDLARFIELWRDQRYRRIARDHVGPLCIDTTWLGADEGPVERPGLFETQLFMDRIPTRRHLYSTFVEAVEGHSRTLDTAQRDVQICHQS